MNDRFLKACRCEPTDRTPIWLMRQAGRYLPEYRALRERYDMLTMCRTPDLAVQVTLQPLSRFDFDAAILFSDIMIPLGGMGIDFSIQESVGPVVANPVRNSHDARSLRLLEPERDVPYVMESVRLLRRELTHKVPLIGFAGAPFTLASYIIEGRPSRELLKTKALMFTDQEAWVRVMGILSESIAAYARAQIDSGAQAIQLFDSWVGSLGPREYERFVLPFTRRILDSLKPSGVPVIHFGTGTSELLELQVQAGGDVIGIDWRIPLKRASKRIGNLAIQGNLDPTVLLTNPKVVRAEASTILEQADGRPGHIFNLGHGVLPGTPIENVRELVDTVHGYKGSLDATG